MVTVMDERMVQVRCLKDGQLNLHEDQNGNPTFGPVVKGDIVGVPASQVSILWMEPADDRDEEAAAAFVAARKLYDEKQASIRELKALQDPRNQARMAAQETARALAAVMGQPQGEPKPRRGRPPKDVSEELSGLED